MSLANDPGLQAFLRIKSLQQAEIEADRVAKLAEIRAVRDAAKMSIELQEKAGARDINQDYEARGLYRSGGRVEDLEEFRDATNQAYFDEDLQFNIGANTLNRESMREITALERRTELERAAALDRENQKRLLEATALRQQEQALYARQQYEAQIRFQQEERDRRAALASSASSAGGTSGGSSLVPGAGFTNTRTRDSSLDRITTPYSSSYRVPSSPKVTPKPSSYKPAPKKTSSSTKSNKRYF